MKTGRSRWKSVLWGSVAFAITASLLVVSCYPVGVTILFVWQFPSFTPIWKADLRETATFLLCCELVIAALVGTSVYWMREDLVRPRDVGI